MYLSGAGGKDSRGKSSPPPVATVVDGELSRQYNCPRGAIRLKKSFGLELVEEGMELGIGRLMVNVLRAR